MYKNFLLKSKLVTIFMAIGIFNYLWSQPLQADSLIFPSSFELLFKAVQKNEVFSDQKKFVDCSPRYPVKEIMERYQNQKTSDTFNLKNFVGQNFDTLFLDTTDIIAHIEHLWTYLSHEPDNNSNASTLIPLPHNYIVPGGRFREIYYWDSYFTMLGLQESGKEQMIKDMLDNFAYLIEQFGHIPNGNRTYYLSRSQPPFFGSMIALYANLHSDKKKAVFEQYREALEKEYLFWMSGKRMVEVKPGVNLNRYWDNKKTPRPESWKQDMETFEESGRDSSVFRDLRAAAESGWDFSSRWLADGESLSSINTTHIVPVDLNSLIYFMETLLSKAYNHDYPEKAKHYAIKARERKQQIIDACWNTEKKWFFDYNITTKEQTGRYSLAGIYPLYFGIVDTVIAQKMAKTIQSMFLKPGGLVTTPYYTGQQWDAPNGWAPLQWLSYKGLKNYGINDLANTIAKRWINLNVKVFFETNKMMEKYDVENLNRKGGGGEYELQDGFGWTNGVFLKLWNEQHAN